MGTFEPETAGEDCPVPAPGELHDAPIPQSFHENLGEVQDGLSEERRKNRRLERKLSAIKRALLDGETPAAILATHYGAALA